MAKNNKTIFQRLGGVIKGHSGSSSVIDNFSSNTEPNKILFQTSDKEEYEKKLRTMSQDKFLSMQWIKAGYDNTEKTIQTKNQMHLLYYDCDLMDAWPEINAALDIMSEEACVVGSNGKMVNVTSSSERIRSILEDLFVNRLNINVMLPMITRSMCKYGNEFMLLNCNSENGVLGWRELPVSQIERLENGMVNPNVSVVSNNMFNGNPDDTHFVWVGKNENLPYKNWQVSHFRLLSNSFFLPYGMSVLHGARRAWKMLSIMEDMMLVYRLERSIERRIFKIFVGNLDPQDVPAYVQQIANNFKRTPIIDPLTGQIDLRKNFMPVWRKTPIPLLDGRTITIEDLAKEYENGKINYVYSIQDKTKKIVPGKVVWCGKNYTAKKMIKITLDDGTYMSMAPEHEVIMRDGSKKRADELLSGESIMPFYRKVNENVYELVYNPSSDKYESSFDLFSEKSNNENLIELEKNKKCEVLKIEWIDGDDVYCMSVVGINGEDDRHNFALRTFYNDDTWCENGCFVSNSVDSDYFIPIRTENAPTPIESLPAAQNMTSMDDINYMENKVLAALRIPKSFLNFQEAQGKGQNLSIMDIRFSRKINKIQQAILMELNKIAIIHLYLLGFTDDLTNFSLSMNNPSTQIEAMELENLQKKLQIAQTALSDPGNGIPILSMHRTLREIMKMSDKEIADNINEIRLEKALAAELEKTSQIIKRTGIFDPVDNIYGEAGAEYTEEGGGNEEGGDGFGGNGGPGGFGGADFGSDLDTLDEPGGDEMGDIGGEMDSIDMNNAPSADEGSIPTMESIFMNNKPLITEYLERIKKTGNKKENIVELEKADIYDKNFFINEEMNYLISELNSIVKNSEKNEINFDEIIEE